MKKLRIECAIDPRDVLFVNEDIGGLIFKIGNITVNAQLEELIILRNFIDRKVSLITKLKTPKQ